MVREWTGWGVALTVLALAALGRSVLLHFLRPHANCSPCIRQSRVALLVLLLTGEGSLLLLFLSLFPGYNYVVLDFSLSRVMELLCPLLFVDACLAYYASQGDSGKYDRNGFSCTMLNKMSSTKSRKESSPKTAFRYSEGYMTSFMSFLKLCLWMMAIGVSIITLFSLKLYPCFIRICPSRLILSLNRDTYDLLISTDQGTNEPSSVSLSEIGNFSTLTKEEKYAALFQSAENYLFTRSKDEHKLCADQNMVGDEWMCVQNVRFEVFLYSLFYLLLLLYVAFHVWSSRQLTVHHTLSRLPAPGYPCSVQNALPLDGVAVKSSIKAYPIHSQPFSINASASLQPNHNLLSKALSTGMYEQGGTSKRHAGLVLTNGNESDLLENQNETNWLTNDNSALVHVCENDRSSISQRVSVPLFTGHVDIPWAQTTADARLSPRQVTKVKDTADCEVCVQVAPYIPLATVVLVAQNMLLLPLWCAVSWTKSGQLQVLPSCTLFLPTYCAMAFVFHTAINTRP